MSRTILLDFDGVLHSYKSGWQGANVVSDPPVEGAISWLKELLADDRFDAQIYSSRSKHLGGIEAMTAFFKRYGLAEDELSKLKFPTEKPAAWLTIDDRAWCFKGTFPTLDDINNFRPWYQI